MELLTNNFLLCYRSKMFRHGDTLIMFWFKENLLMNNWYCNEDCNEHFGCKMNDRRLIIGDFITIVWCTTEEINRWSTMIIVKFAQISNLPVWGSSTFVWLHIPIGLMSGALFDFNDSPASSNKINPSDITKMPI